MTLLQRTAETVVIRERACRVSGSIGIALYPQHGKDPEILLRHADQAMYLAKKQGKRCYRFFAAGRVLLS